MRLELLAPGTKAVVLRYPIVPKTVLWGAGLAVIGIGAGLLNELLVQGSGSLVQQLLVGVVTGLVLGLGMVFLFEPTKEIRFRGNQINVSWLGGLYIQKYNLNQAIKIEFEHREIPRYGVSERLKLRQGHLRCVIPSAMDGFELLCSNLREDC